MPSILRSVAMTECDDDENDVGDEYDNVDYDGASLPPLLLLPRDGSRTRPAARRGGTATTTTRWMIVQLTNDDDDDDEGGRGGASGGRGEDVESTTTTYAAATCIATTMLDGTNVSALAPPSTIATATAAANARTASSPHRSPSLGPSRPRNMSVDDGTFDNDDGNDIRRSPEDGDVDDGIASDDDDDQTSFANCISLCLARMKTRHRRRCRCRVEYGNGSAADGIDDDVRDFARRHFSSHFASAADDVDASTLRCQRRIRRRIDGLWSSILGQIAVDCHVGLPPSPTPTRDKGNRRNGSSSSLRSSSSYYYSSSSSRTQSIALALGSGVIDHIASVGTSSSCIVEAAYDGLARALSNATVQIVTPRGMVDDDDNGHDDGDGDGDGRGDNRKKISALGAVYLVRHRIRSIGVALAGVEKGVEISGDCSSSCGDSSRPAQGEDDAPPGTGSSRIGDLDIVHDRASMILRSEEDDLARGRRILSARVRPLLSSR